MLTNLFYVKKVRKNRFNMNTKKSLFDKRKLRNRLSIKKNIENKLRLSVFRSNKHIYCQIIDDVKQITLCSSSTLDPDVKKELKGLSLIHI